MTDAIAVVDLGFGDAGKGSVVDWLARVTGARLVVRFNGGAQAGHNVVTDDGRHHTFAQLGAASFVPGVRTLLSRHVVVHPTALLVEARVLARSGVSDALERVVIDRRALVIAPVQQAACRLRELARGDARHGSCGVGVGEAVRDAIESSEDALRAGDLADAARVRRALRSLRQKKRVELAAEARALAGDPRAASELAALEDPRVDEAWLDAVTPLVLRRPFVDDAEAIARALGEGPVLFEGAQGVLLDEHAGFHPHTTWSSCTFANAAALLGDATPRASLARVGVLRAYGVRHGPGPFPTEAPDLGAHLSEPHNDDGPWQGAFRVGWLDAVLARYAIDACDGVDALALTHLDALARAPALRVCDAYEAPLVPNDAALFARDARGAITGFRPRAPGDLVHAASLGLALRAVRPVAIEAPRDPSAFVARVERALGAAVRLVSTGPSPRDKRLRSPV